MLAYPPKVTVSKALHREKAAYPMEPTVLKYSAKIISNNLDKADTLLSKCRVAYYTETASCNNSMKSYPGKVRFAKEEYSNAPLPMVPTFLR
jgi:hypothetical protein